MNTELLPAPATTFAINDHRAPVTITAREREIVGLADQLRNAWVKTQVGRIAYRWDVAEH